METGQLVGRHCCLSEGQEEFGAGCVNLDMLTRHPRGSTKEEINSGMVVAENQRVKRLRQEDHKLRGLARVRLKNKMKRAGGLAGGIVVKYLSSMCMVLVQFGEG